MPLAAYVVSTPTSFMNNRLLVGSPGKCQPIQALPPPNINANPQPQWISPQTQVSNIHSTSTFTVSRFRQNPASNIVKPACMPKTRKPPSSTHAVLIGLMVSPGLINVYGSGGVAPGAAGAGIAAGSCACATVFPQSH